MTRTLILTRHAKSGWDDPRLDDFDRPLTDRGRRSAAAIAGWLRDREAIPGEVIVSGANRTVETWASMRDVFDGDIPMHSDPALYHAAPPSIMATLRAASAKTVLLIGHNPGFAEFAGRIVAEPPHHERFADYPTCATTVATFDVENWTKIDYGTGRCEAFIVPRDLLD